MIALAHLLLVTIYAVGPAAAVAWAWRRRGTPAGRSARRRLWRAAFGGVAVGTVVCVAYAVADGAWPEAGQLFATDYWAGSFILLLGVVDGGLWWATQRLFRLDPRAPAGPGLLGRAVAALLLRAAVAAGLVLPYVLAVSLTYRPRTAPTTDPTRLYGWAFEPVRFPAAVDGTRVAGWWIPAQPGHPSDRTLVLCPGATGGMPAVLPMIAGSQGTSGLRDDGYNVLTFDFRGHGDSGGDLVSYGDLERRDVLGAVNWLMATHPAAARHVVGLGLSTGAAALLAAAVDPSPAGQHIDAVAVYAPYDRLDRLLRAAVTPVAPPPAAWLVEHVALPMADVQVGGRVASFAPADAAAQLWPRPLLVVAGMNDGVIPFARSQAVYTAAEEPKRSLFIVHCDHNDLIRSTAARQAVRQFFGAAGREI